MADRPILFSSEMVRAILDGRKTQTRRAIKPQPPNWLIFKPFEWPPIEGDRIVYSVLGNREKEYTLKCPYGVVGDKLWVRETYYLEEEIITGVGNIWIPMSNIPKSKPTKEYKSSYKADDEPIILTKWRPSIHMPKWACRLWLEITGIRVERLQDIGEEDAKAEGVKPFPQSEGLNRPTTFDDYKGAFHFLWDSLNAKRGYSWESNPWVWVIEFRKAGNGD